MSKRWGDVEHAQCWGKVRYDAASKAIKVAKHVGQRWYRCKACRGFHLAGTR